MGVESKNKSGKNYIANQDLGRFKTRSNSRDTLAQFEDPTYLGFKLFFPGIGSNETAGLLGGIGNPNSALYYLNQIGDSVRVKMLTTFINMLQKINNEYPWYFQSIGGLDEAWKSRSELDKIRVQKQLTIECLESLDFRMTSLIDLYRKSAYDWNNKREILTDNLRQFDMSVMVYDMRSFHKTLQGDTIDGQTPGSTSKQESANAAFFGENEFEQSSFSFQFSFVQINLESGAGMFSSINNATNDAASQSIVFDYELVEESNIFRILSLLYKSDNDQFWYVKDYMNNIMTTLSGQGSGAFDTSLLGGQSFETSPEVELSGREDLKNKLENAKKEAGAALGKATDDFVTALGADLQAATVGAIKGKLNSLLLGNVYGFSAAGVIAGGGRGAASQASEQITKGAGNSLGKVFD